MKKDKLKLKLYLVSLGLILGVKFFPGCNRSLFDTKYGFNKALVIGDDSSLIFDIESWKDYQGEQLQIITKDNFVLLTSSYDTNLFFGNSENINALKVANNAITELGELHDLSVIDDSVVFNKEFFDLNWSYNKSIIFNKNKALILPIGKWKDYEGEQLQVITKDGLVLLLSSYNSKLVNDEASNLKADEFACKYVGEDGNVVDYSNNNSSNFNYDIIDFNYAFNKAIIVKDNKAIIIPVTQWCDYDGEQIQIKIKDELTMVTAAYDTILVNDSKSILKAIDIAKNLCDGEVVDYTIGYDTNESFYNKTIIDFNIGFSNGILSNDDSATAINIEKWCDYEGEQLQVKLSTGDVLLTSSIFLDLINAGTKDLNASILAKSYVSDGGKFIDYSYNNIDKKTMNKYIIDLENKFNYALKVKNGNVVIIPLKTWKDFYNDGDEDNKMTNCEQLQLTLPDGTIIVTTSYDTILVRNTLDINTIANMFKSKNGVICNITKYVGEPSTSSWNLALFDTKYKFSYAILSANDTTQLFKISKWKDYVDGEQLQIILEDNTGFLTSFVNTNLIYPKTEGIEEVIADAWNGTLDQNLDNDKKRVKKNY